MSAPLLILSAGRNLEMVIADLTKNIRIYQVAAAFARAMTV